MSDAKPLKKSGSKNKGKEVFQTQNSLEWFKYLLSDVIILLSDQ